jgi:predicted transcriptional regulator of viral defense system
MYTQHGKWTGPAAFFAAHPVFSHAEFVEAHTARGRSERTSNSLLRWYLGTGRLLRIRRGLYATVSVGMDAAAFSADPYLIAAKSRDDAVISYHTALSFHGKAYSVWRRYQCLTAERARPFTYGAQEFVSLQAPSQIRALPDFGGGVIRCAHAGDEVRVTTLERTLADVFHAPEHGGGWEEIWRSLEMVEFFDLRAVVDCTLRLRSDVTAARVGFFLEQHREQLMVEDAHLEPLLQHAPRQPRYLGPQRTSGRLISRWNLVVPESVLQRRWEDPQ